MLKLERSRDPNSPVILNQNITISLNNTQKLITKKYHSTNKLQLNQTDVLTMNSESNNSQARIVAVCTSPLTGTKKTNIMQGILLENYGLIGDGHADNQTLRQLSLLAIESIQKMRDLGLEVNPGDFAENITTEGIELKKLPIGARINLGNNSVLEVVQIGKECVSPCEIGRSVGECIMPTEGIFCKVLESGKIGVGDELRVI
jgi:MOSC domain-containing protein YiiM